MSFLEKMLRDLGWQDRQVNDGDEPPDFLLDSADGRCAVEVTRIFQREHAKGSPDAAQERQSEQFVTALRDAYFSNDAAQSIPTTALL